MDPTPSPARPDDGTRFRNRLIGVGLAAGLTLAGLGVAGAQTSDPTAPEPETDVVEPAPGRAGKMIERFRHGLGHRLGGGMGIRGEFTTRGTEDGTWQTIAHQTGEVTAVSASSLTVRSEDGFSRTYVVNDDTLVNAGNDGIADVKEGDEIRVKATVDDGTATAVDVHDLTNIRASREKWMPGPPVPALPEASDEDGDGSA